ncbi:unnamed protein product [Closterium sp. Yama58-4]|nr:unnamed protein product [Closterium sp. Yama58-4]
MSIFQIHPWKTTHTIAMARSQTRGQMADQEAPGWREKAGAFISTSSFKLKAAGSAVAGAAGEAGAKVKTSWQQNVQPKVAEAATRAAVAAEGAKTRMHTTWESTKESWNTKVLPRMEAGLETTARVAADTGSMLKQGLMETTEKVKASRVGQQLTELSANGMERSKGLLQKVDWRRVSTHSVSIPSPSPHTPSHSPPSTQPRIPSPSLPARLPLSRTLTAHTHMNAHSIPFCSRPYCCLPRELFLDSLIAPSPNHLFPSPLAGRPGAPGDATLVFGTPLDAFASRQRGTAVPFVVIQCCNFILQNGLVTEYLFESENDSHVVKRLMHMFDTDPNADIPPETSPLDVGQLLLVYLKCLPEPLMTFALFPGVATVGSSDVTQLRRLLHTLPPVNLETLHAVLCLLYRVSLHADVNKMDAQSLAAEFAPVLLWPRPEVPPSPSPSPSPSPHASSTSGPFDSSPSSKPPSSTARSPSLSSLSLDETRDGAGAGAAAAGDGGDGSKGMDGSSASKSAGGGAGGGSGRVSEDVPSLMAPSSPPALTPKGSAASAAAAAAGGGGGGGDAMASPAMRRAQSEKGMRVGGGGNAAAAAAADGPAVVKANGESSAPEIPLEEEPTQAQTAIPIANQKIQWRSVDGVPNRGAVRFFPKGTNGCKVEVRREYEG